MVSDMNTIFIKKIVFLIPAIFLISCSQKKVEIDLSNLPKPKIKNTAEKDNQETLENQPNS